MKRAQLKLHISNESLRNTFITHVESVSSDHEVVIIVSGEAVILEYPMLTYTEVFYTSWGDAMLNRNPVITLGVDAIQEALNNGDREAIGFKRAMCGILE